MTHSARALTRGSRNCTFARDGGTGLLSASGGRPDEVGIRYPGTAVLDPSGLLSQYDEQFGVAGALPGAYSPSPGLTAPKAPVLPNVPSLIPPVNPTGAGAGPLPGVASGVRPSGPLSAWDRAQAQPRTTDPSAPGQRPQGKSLLDRALELKRQGR